MIVAGDEADGFGDVRRVALDFEQRRTRAASAAATDAAALRLCTSSPMCSACAISGFSSIPPDLRAAQPEGPRSTLAIHFRRVDHLGAVGPEAQHLAEPFVEVAEATIACSPIRARSTPASTG